jgi:LPXTG-site transpeptidase (sortase) family protein
VAGGERGHATPPEDPTNSTISLDSPRPAPPPAGSRRRRVLRAVARAGGELMTTLGLVVALFAAYEIWGRAAIVADHQRALDAQLEQQWSQEPEATPTETPDESSTDLAPEPVSASPGDAIARLYLPRLRNSWVVVEGVDPQYIEYAPGHYPGTAMPGELGNFSVAGHRSHAIFWDLDQVQAGDAVIVETRSRWYVYRVTQSRIVPPTALEVVAPVPNQPGVEPTQAHLTITTCNPRWSNYERLIVHATLERVQASSAGRPAELEGL